MNTRQKTIIDQKNYKIIYNNTNKMRYSFHCSVKQNCDDTRKNDFFFYVVFQATIYYQKFIQVCRHFWTSRISFNCALNIILALNIVLHYELK